MPTLNPNMTILDWSIMGGMLIFIIYTAIMTKKYTQSVADFLAANRCAGRYLLCIAGGMAGMGAISIVGKFEMFYNAGFTATWWALMMTPLHLIMALTGFVIYRLRETRALTLAQFFEVRYNKPFRIYAGILVWVSGIVNFGIFPAVGARFFMYFCGLPDLGDTHFGALTVSNTYMLVMAFLLGVSLFFVFLGGQIAVMITDFVQGMFTNTVLLIILGYFLWVFDWSTMIDIMKHAPEKQSLLQPFHTSKVEGFNVWFFIIQLFSIVYFHKAWQGSQAYNTSAKNAHEARMAGILGEWRGMIMLLLVMFLPIGAWVVMHHPTNAHFIGVAGEVNQVLDQIQNPQIMKQVRVSVVLAKVLPTGITGLLAAIMMTAFISTHDTYLHSWGSIFIQDVVLPFRKKPFTPQQHLWLLRFSILFVAVFIFLFSVFFQQNDYILMFFAITGAIWLGGAGSAIIGGLYWKRGSTSGAFAAVFIGSSMAIISMILQNTWSMGEETGFYFWMKSRTPWLLSGATYVLEGVAARVPGINWKVGPDKFPLNGQWISFFTIVTCITAYVACSLFEWLVLRKKAFNMDRMLHRGQWAIKGEHGHEIRIPATGLRAILPNEEFSITDKIIYYAKLAWTLTWFCIFVIGLIFWAKASDDLWANFWWWKVWITVVIGVGTTVWFLIGGIIDIRGLFHTLRTLKRDHRDMGMVVGHHNIDEEPLDGEAAPSLEEIEQGIATAPPETPPGVRFETDEDAGAADTGKADNEKK